MSVLAKALPGSAFAVRRRALPYETVWNYIEDLQTAIPSLDGLVGGFEIIEQAESRIVARVAASAWSRVRILVDVRLEPGWCWMTARRGIYAVGFAAEQDGTSTRVAHLEAVCLPTAAWARPATAAGLRLLSYSLRHHVRNDLNGLMRELGGAPSGAETSQPDTDA